MCKFAWVAGLGGSKLYKVLLRSTKANDLKKRRFCASEPVAPGGACVFFLYWPSSTLKEQKKIGFDENYVE
jgi:hypothetical protein